MGDTDTSQTFQEWKQKNPRLGALLDIGDLVLNGFFTGIGVTAAILLVTKVHSTVTGQ